MKLNVVKATIIEEYEKKEEAHEVKRKVKVTMLDTANLVGLLDAEVQ